MPRANKANRHFRNRKKQAHRKGHTEFDVRVWSHPDIPMPVAEMLVKEYGWDTAFVAQNHGNGVGLSFHVGCLFVAIARKLAFDNHMKVAELFLDEADTLLAVMPMYSEKAQSLLREFGEHLIVVAAAA